MQILKNSYFLLTLFSGALSLQADFIDVSVWKRQSNSGAAQQVILCGDLHEPEVIGHEQAKTIVDLLATYNPKNSCIILEDFADIKSLAKRVDSFFDYHNYPEDRAKLHKRLELVSAAQEEQRTASVKEFVQDALFSIPFFADAKHIPVHTIDFRTCLSSRGPRLIINDYEAGSEIIPWVLEQLISEIAAFNDGAILNDFYAERVKRYAPVMELLCGIMREHELIFQELPAYFVDSCITDVALHDRVMAVFDHTLNFINKRIALQSLFANIKAGNISHNVRKELMEIFVDLLDLSSVELIDALIMHELYNKQVLLLWPGTVFICAGNTHTQAIQKVLSDIGYEPIDSRFDMNGVDIKDACEEYLKQCEHDTVIARLKTYVIYAWCYITQFFI